jgi:HEPN domain-containing protein
MGTHADEAKSTRWEAALERSRDWWVQSEADFRHARNSTEVGDYDWACFASHQAAEKALKSLFQAHHQEARGHTVSLMLGRLPSGLGAPAEVVEAAKALDKLYIPTRYPNGLEQGAPTEFFTRREAEEAMRHAGTIIDYCRNHLGR